MPIALTDTPEFRDTVEEIIIDVLTDIISRYVPIVPRAAIRRVVQMLVGAMQSLDLSSIMSVVDLALGTLGFPQFSGEAKKEVRRKLEELPDELTVECPETEDEIGVDGEDGEYTCPDCGETIYVEDGVATHWVPLVVGCPMTGDEVEVDYEEGDYECPVCGGNICVDEFSAEHGDMRKVTCRESGDQIWFPDDGDDHDCPDCGATLSVVNGRAQHIV